MEKEKHLGLRIDAETHKKLKSLAVILSILVDTFSSRIFPYAASFNES